MNKIFYNVFMIIIIFNTSVYFAMIYKTQGNDYIQYTRFKRQQEEVIVQKDIEDNIFFGYRHTIGSSAVSREDDRMLQVEEAKKLYEEYEELYKIQQQKNLKK